MKTNPLSPIRMTFREYVASNARFLKGENIPRDEKDKQIDFICDSPLMPLAEMTSAIVAITTAPLRTIKTVFKGVFGKTNNG